MKNLLKVVGLLLMFSSIASAECTGAEKAKMIMNGIEQSVIDEMCSKTASKKDVQQPVQVIINNSSSSNNSNVVTNTNTNRSPIHTDGVQRQRFYVGAALGSSSGVNTLEYEYYDYYYGYQYYYYGEYEFDAVYSALSIGYVLDSNNRFEITSTSFSPEDLDESYDGTEINFIVVLGNNDVSVGDLRLYYSIGLGSYRTGEVDGFSFNAGIGINYTMNDNLEFDLGYNSRAILWDTLEMEEFYDYYDLSTSLVTATASVRYKF